MGQNKRKKASTSRLSVMLYETTDPELPQDHGPTILVLNGPNLNLLGTREPEHYGALTLDELIEQLKEYVVGSGYEILDYQSNHEGRLIDMLHGADVDCVGVVFNPGAFTHYSYALHDAVEAISVPVVEVHLSDITSRESWRARSVIAPACVTQYYGQGIDGYKCAIDDIVKIASRASEGIQE